MLSTNEIRTVSERAQHRCEYCKSPADFATGSFELEHIEPKAKGGTDQLNNIALACNGCNRHKYTCTKALDPVSLKTVPLFHPRLHTWDAHFKWSANLLEIVGITPTGRATIERLKMNRRPLRNLRMALIKMDSHPPS